MIDSRITSNQCNHIWLCNHSLNGGTLQLQNGGRPSDIAQYASSGLVYILLQICEIVIDAGARERSPAPIEARPERGSVW